MITRRSPEQGMSAAGVDPMRTIVFAETEEQYAEARKLFIEYAGSLGFGLEFQHFDDELARFPGEYRPPGGALLLAVSDGETAGCVAVRRFEGTICEMKRLYVRPEHRGTGLGGLLARAAVERARALGYTRMRLDTVAAMVEANALYRGMGFKPIEPYRHNPVLGASFMELSLD
jgi:putative acetyltransferase